MAVVLKYLEDNGYRELAQPCAEVRLRSLALLLDFPLEHLDLVSTVLNC